MAKLLSGTRVYGNATVDTFLTVAGNITANNLSSLSWQTVQTSNFSATNNNAYPVNTTSTAITATLPSSPSAGNTIYFTDYAGTFGTNNLTINTQSPDTIAGQTSLLANINFSSIEIY